MALSEFRQSIGVAGYRYVSDVHRMGPCSPIEELPVFRPHGLPMGGGSYQRLLPSRVITELVKRDQPPSILYYHSYDFGATLPTMSSIRSAAVAKQLLGRHRVSKLFLMFAQRYGSEACTNVAS